MNQLHGAHSRGGRRPKQAEGNKKSVFKFFFRFAFNYELLFDHVYWVDQKVPSSFPIRCYEKAQMNIVFGQPSISNHHVYTNVIQIYLSVIL